jgi:hypothetical protein
MKAMKAILKIYKALSWNATNYNQLYRPKNSNLMNKFILLISCLVAIVLSQGFQKKCLEAPVCTMDIKTCDLVRCAEGTTCTKVPATTCECAKTECQPNRGGDTVICAQVEPCSTVECGDGKTCKTIPRTRKECAKAVCSNQGGRSNPEPSSESSATETVAPEPAGCVQCLIYWTEKEAMKLCEDPCPSGTSCKYDPGSCDTCSGASCEVKLYI